MSRAVVLIVVLALAACATTPLVPPPTYIAPTPPKPKTVEQVCATADIWAPGTQAEAATAIAPLVHADPNVAHLLKEWQRLRDDAEACAASEVR